MQERPDIHPDRDRGEPDNGVRQYRHELTDTPLLIRLLGGFCVLKRGDLVQLNGRKASTLLSALALRCDHGASRDALLSILWPETDTRLASQSLSTLLYFLHKALGGAISGAAPVIREGTIYRLNAAAGVRTDVDWFEARINAGDEHTQNGRQDAAAACYREAIHGYRGDLEAGSDVRAVVERERLRACYLRVLSRLADYQFLQGDITACLEYASKILINDPCREDAHRVIMACYVRCGARTQALRQYRLCEAILSSELEAVPELATRELYDRARLASNIF